MWVSRQDSHECGRRVFPEGGGEAVPWCHSHGVPQLLTLSWFLKTINSSAPAAIGDGGTGCDRGPVPAAPGHGGAGPEGGDGDPGGWGEAGPAAGRGNPGPPGAEVHRAEEDPGPGGEDLQEQERRGFLAGTNKVSDGPGLGSSQSKHSDTTTFSREHWAVLTQLFCSDAFLSFHCSLLSKLRNSDDIIKGEDEVEKPSCSVTVVFLFCRNTPSGKKNPQIFPCLEFTSAWSTVWIPSAASSWTQRRSSAPPSSRHTSKKSKRPARMVRGRRGRRGRRRSLLHQSEFTLVWNILLMCHCCSRETGKMKEMLLLECKCKTVGFFCHFRKNGNKNYSSGHRRCQREHVNTTAKDTHRLPQV